MKRRVLRVIACWLAGLLLFVASGVAITWRHWWWPIRSANVWIDGSLLDRCKVYRGCDGRYLIYYPNRSKAWLLHEAIVPGRWQPVDEADAYAPGDIYGWPPDIWVFPVAAFSVKTPIACREMFAYSDLADYQHLTYQPNGFSFTNRVQDLRYEDRGKLVHCRVSLR
jgi:hypothetical protein